MRWLQRFLEAGVVATIGTILLQQLVGRSDAEAVSAIGQSYGAVLKAIMYAESEPMPGADFGYWSFPEGRFSIGVDRQHQHLSIGNWSSETVCLYDEHDLVLATITPWSYAHFPVTGSIMKRYTRWGSLPNQRGSSNSRSLSPSSSRRPPPPTLVQPPIVSASANPPPLRPPQNQSQSPHIARVRGTLAEPIWGYRAWCVRNDLLAPLFVGDTKWDFGVWHPGIQVAICDSSESRAHLEPVPAVDCFCGIYVSRTFIDAVHRGTTSNKEFVLGAVQLFGKVVEHHEGWRGEKARVLALIGSEDNPQTKRLADAYQCGLVPDDVALNLMARELAC